MSLLLPSIALAASPTNTSIETNTVSTTSTIETTSKEECLSNVTSLDLKEAKLGLDLGIENLSLTGVAPKACADRLSLSDIKRSDSSKSPEELKDVVLEKSDSLKDYSTTIQAQVTYSGDDQNPTLRDCIANNKTSAEIVDLAKDSRFSRVVSLYPELAIAGLIGEPMDLKSPEFLKMEKQIAKLDCKDCNSDWSKISAHLKEARGFDSPLLASMMNKLFESALVEMDTKITEASSLSALEKLRLQLIEMDEYATSDEQKGLHLALFGKIIERNNQLAATGFKTATMATKHVDFARDTYSKMASLKALPEDQRSELKDRAAELAPGKEERLQLLSTIDGDHPEVKKYLKDANRQQQNLQSQMRYTCSGRMNQYKFTQCGELQNRYQENQKHMGDLQSRFTLADNQNWEGIFSQWDKRNVAYDQNWKTSFINPVAPILTNSMPDVYDPRDPKYRNIYQNFDASKLYQPNAVTSESLPLYTEQTWTSTPFVQN